jgi:hypothetical protein
VIARSDGVSEGQCQRVGIIGRSQPALSHVAFALELDGIATVFQRITVFNSCKVSDQLRVIVDPEFLDLPW